MIDFKKDLGLQDQQFPELHLVLRPAKAPQVPAAVHPDRPTPRVRPCRATIVFNGQRYNVGLPVNSTLDWKAYRFGYEYDFISRIAASAGSCWTSSTPTSRPRSPARSSIEFTQAQGADSDRSAASSASMWCRTSRSPAKSRGSRCRIPRLIKDNTGHYLDVNVYGTLNFTNYIGVQVGYRSLDVGYCLETDTGSFTVQGVYFGVARYWTRRLDE